MYIELITVDDNMARSFTCAEEVQNGGFVKVKGLAKLSKYGVNLGGEAYETVKLTDAIGDEFAIVAPEDHRYDERLIPGDVPDVKANELFRGYLLHRGQEVRVEKANVDGEVAVGDLLSPKAGSYQLTKAVTTGDVGVNVNVVGKILEIGKYQGKDTYVIKFFG